MGGTCSGGSVSFRRALGSDSRRWVLNARSFQFINGWDPAGRPRTTGAANCMAVWFRIRTTKSRIAMHWARGAVALGAPGAGNARHMDCSLATGPTSCLAASGDSSRNPQIVERYLALTLAAAAVAASVASGLPSADRYL